MTYQTNDAGHLEGRYITVNRELATSIGAATSRSEREAMEWMDDVAADVASALRVAQANIVAQMTADGADAADAATRAGEIVAHAAARWITDEVYA